MDERWTEQKDLITGLPVTDREDEYVRQAVEKLLLERGYPPSLVEVDVRRTLTIFDEPIVVAADLLVRVADRPGLLLRCPRGSLVTRERESHRRGPAPLRSLAPLGLDL